MISAMHAASRQPRTVFITGTSSGIGRACALRLERSGWRVFAGVRKSADGEALRAESSGAIEPVIIDVADTGSIRRAADVVRRGLGGSGALDGLVNNAGIGIGGPLELVDVDELRLQFEVNVFGHIALIQELLPQLRRAAGCIVNISSVSGRFTAPFLGPYSASKYALAALSDALRREVAGQGVRVSIIEPGCVESAIWDKGKQRTETIRRALPEAAVSLYGAHLDAMGDAIEQATRTCIPADRVARTVERALTAGRPRARYLVGRDAQIGARMAWLLPDRVLDYLIARGLKKMAGRKR
jgi:NAD(P)-dependent dehydrogenase (short-subunit alcohol dehydrogenase family)